MNNNHFTYIFQVRGIPEYSFTVNKTEGISESGFYDYIDLLAGADCVHQIPEYYTFQEEEVPLTLHNLEIDFSVTTYPKNQYPSRLEPVSCIECNSTRILYSIIIHWEFYYTHNVENSEELNFYLAGGSDWEPDSPQISRPTTPVRQITRPGR